MRQGKHSAVKKRPLWPFAMVAVILLAVAAAWGTPQVLEDRQPPQAQPPLQEEP